MVTHGTTSRSTRTLGGIAIIFVEHMGEENGEPKRERGRGEGTPREMEEEREHIMVGRGRKREEGDTDGGELGFALLGQLGLGYF